MRIPILDLTDDTQEHWEQYSEAVLGVLRSTRFILGENVQAFEQEMASYLGVGHAVACNSGTDALIIALRAMGIGPGDEVVTTPFTFYATAEAVSAVGATPVFADIEARSFNLDLADAERRITPRTKAIIPVHLFGQAMDMGAVNALAQRHGLKVLEDVAQATGSECNGSKLGSFGLMGAFSFFPSKNLGAFGDGGLISTDDPSLAELARALRMHGSRRRYHHDMVAYNSRLDEVQAAILRAKLPRLEAANEGRRQVAARYGEFLAGVPGVVLPELALGKGHVYHQFTLRVPATKREGLKAALEAQGIGTMVYYPVPLHRQPVYASLGTPALPVAEQAAAEVLSLPVWPTLSADKQQTVARAVADYLRAG